MNRSFASDSSVHINAALLLTMHRMVKGCASAVAGEVRLAQTPKGATEELKKAFSADTATMINVLDLNNSLH